MIARLQKSTVFAYLALMAVWLLLVWPSFSLFVVGVLTLGILSAFYLGLLFLLIHYWNQTDPAPRATWVELG
ncbi:MAG TPA: permease, partial [Burkholderiaceae bacterium]|nr:permease [Burkholderiaceae bacterium]